MYTSTTDYLNSTYDSYAASQGTEASSSLGQDAFLELLCTQLQWQDPLDPVDDTDMLAQLAQFSSLEQMTQMNEQMESITDLLNDQSLLNATSYLGKDVEASGSSMSKDGDTCSCVTYTLSEDASGVWAHVLNADGDIVNSVELGAMEAGDHKFVWDGLDSSGSEADDGQYAVAFVAEDAAGEQFYVSTMVTGTVEEVYAENGSVMLGLSDGRTVNMANVTRVVDLETANNDDNQED